MGAGLLPVAIYKNMLIFLMGKERNSMLWCDFGGGKENNEEPIETAIREGGEEINGLLGLNDKLYNKVTTSLIAPIEYNRYTSFLFNIRF